MDGLQGPLGTTKMGAATLANLSLHSLPTRSPLLSHDLHLGRGKRGKELLGIAQKTTSKDVRGAGWHPSPLPWVSILAAHRRAPEEGEESLDKRVMGNQEEPGWLPLPAPLAHSAVYERRV